jgi:hypothetical protein
MKPLLSLLVLGLSAQASAAEVQTTRLVSNSMGLGLVDSRDDHPVPFTTLAQDFAHLPNADNLELYDRMRSQMTIAGNNANAVEIGFTFNYDGIDYEQMIVGGHGFVAFGCDINDIPVLPANLSTYTDDCDSLNRLIAVAWHDWGVQTNVGVHTFGSAPGRRTVIRWNATTAQGLDAQNPNLASTFELILFESSNRVEMRYQKLITNPANPVHVGLRISHSGGQGRSLTYYSGANNGSLSISNRVIGVTKNLGENDWMNGPVVVTIDARDRTGQTNWGVRHTRSNVALRGCSGMPGGAADAEACAARHLAALSNDGTALLELLHPHVQFDEGPTQSLYRPVVWVGPANDRIFFQPAITIMRTPHLTTVDRNPGGTVHEDDDDFYSQTFILPSLEGSTRRVRPSLRLHAGEQGVYTFRMRGLLPSGAVYIGLEEPNENATFSRSSVSDDSSYYKDFSVQISVADDHPIRDGQGVSFMGIVLVCTVAPCTPSSTDRVGFKIGVNVLGKQRATELLSDRDGLALNNDRQQLVEDTEYTYYLKGKNPGLLGSNPTGVKIECPANDNDYAHCSGVTLGQAFTCVADWSCTIDEAIADEALHETTYRLRLTPSHAALDNVDNSSGTITFCSDFAAGTDPCVPFNYHLTNSNRLPALDWGFYRPDGQSYVFMDGRAQAHATAEAPYSLADEVVFEDADSHPEAKLLRVDALKLLSFSVYGTDADETDWDGNCDTRADDDETDDGVDEPIDDTQALCVSVVAPGLILNNALTYTFANNQGRVNFEDLQVLPNNGQPHTVTVMFRDSTYADDGHGRAVRGETKQVFKIYPRYMVVSLNSEGPPVRQRVQLNEGETLDVYVRAGEPLPDGISPVYSMDPNGTRTPAPGELPAGITATLVEDSFPVGAVERRYEITAGYDMVEAGSQTTSVPFFADFLDRGITRRLVEDIELTVSHTNRSPTTALSRASVRSDGMEVANMLWDVDDLGGQVIAMPVDHSLRFVVTVTDPDNGDLVDVSFSLVQDELETRVIEAVSDDEKTFTLQVNNLPDNRQHPQPYRIVGRVSDGVAVEDITFLVRPIYPREVTLSAANNEVLPTVLEGDSIDFVARAGRFTSRAANGDLLEDFGTLALPEGSCPAGFTCALVDPPTTSGDGFTEQVLQLTADYSAADDQAIRTLPAEALPRVSAEFAARAQISPVWDADTLVTAAQLVVVDINQSPQLTLQLDGDEAPQVDGADFCAGLPFELVFDAENERYDAEVRPGCSTALTWKAHSGGSDPDWDRNLAGERQLVHLAMTQADRPAQLAISDDQGGSKTASLTSSFPADLATPEPFNFTLQARDLPPLGIPHLATSKSVRITPNFFEEIRVFNGGIEVLPGDRIEIAEGARLSDLEVWVGDRNGGVNQLATNVSLAAGSPQWMSLDNNLVFDADQAFGAAGLELDLSATYNLVLEGGHINLTLDLVGEVDGVEIAQSIDLRVHNTDQPPTIAPLAGFLFANLCTNIADEEAFYNVLNPGEELVWQGITPCEILETDLRLVIPLTIIDPDTGGTAPASLVSSAGIGELMRTDTGTGWQFAWTPGFAAAEERPYDIAVIAGEGRNSRAILVSLQIINLNQAPALTGENVGVTIVQEIDEGQTVILPLTAEDGDGDSIYWAFTDEQGAIAANLVTEALEQDQDVITNRYSLRLTPDFAAVSELGGSATAVINVWLCDVPLFLRGGIVVCASEDDQPQTHRVSYRLEVIVNDTNRAATLTPEPGVSFVRQGDPLVLDLALSDPDGRADAIRLETEFSGDEGDGPTIESIPGEPGDPATYYRLRWTPENRHVGERYTVTLTGTEAHAQVDAAAVMTSTWTIQVLNADDPVRFDYSTPPSPMVQGAPWVHDIWVDSPDLLADSELKPAQTVWVVRLAVEDGFGTDGLIGLDQDRPTRCLQLDDNGDEQDGMQNCKVTVTWTPDREAVGRRMQIPLLAFRGPTRSELAERLAENPDYVPTAPDLERTDRVHWDRLTLAADSMVVAANAEAPQVGASAGAPDEATHRVALVAEVLDGEVSEWRWEVIGWPGDKLPAIDDPSAATTFALLSGMGRYTFAVSGANASYRSAAITVEADLGNFPPLPAIDLRSGGVSVSAMGSLVPLIEGNTLSLTASAAASGDANIEHSVNELVVRWEIVGDASQIVILTPNGLDTQIQIQRLGTVQLKLSLTDPEGATASKELAFEVVRGATGDQAELLTQGTPQEIPPEASPIDYMGCSGSGGLSGLLLLLVSLLLFRRRRLATALVLLAGLGAQAAPAETAAVKTPAEVPAQVEKVALPPAAPATDVQTTSDSDPAKPQPATAEAKPAVAVLDLKPMGVSPMVVATLTNVLANRLDMLNKYQVTSMEDVRNMLDLDATRIALGCDDLDCTSAVGKSLGVDLVVSGSVARLGLDMLISVQRVNPTSGKAEVRAERKVRLKGGSPDSAMREIAAEISGIDIDEADVIAAAILKARDPGRLHRLAGMGLGAAGILSSASGFLLYGMGTVDALTLHTTLVDEGRFDDDLGAQASGRHTAGVLAGGVGVAILGAGAYLYLTAPTLELH